MSKKVRIHDLAKQYGMPGKDLAAKLRDLGFSQIKSHMSALDEFELLQVQGVLSAHGLTQVSEESDVAQDEGPTGGLKLVKKRKKQRPDDVGEADEADELGVASEAAEPYDEEAEAEEEARVQADSTAGTAVELEQAGPLRSPAQAEAGGAIPTAGPVERPAAAATTPSFEEPAADEPDDEAERPAAAAAERSATSEREPGAGAERPGGPPSAAAPGAAQAAHRAPPTQAEPPERSAAPPMESSPTESAAPAAPAAPRAADAAPSRPSPARAAEAGRERGEATLQPAPRRVEKPADRTAETAGAAPKRRGNVIGFIDPANFQQKERKKPESRRLRSNDDVAPDVRPTFSHDRSKALMRGAGGARGELTAAQLRERESSRFLRRRGPGGIQSGGGRRGGRGGRQGEVTASPNAGGTVTVEEPITIQKLAEALKLKSNLVQKVALNAQFGMFTVNSVLDEDTARLIAGEFDVDLEVKHDISAEEAHLEQVKLKRSTVEEEELELRPPTVAFLGHVDHGKTTLIDHIRQSQVAEGEAGGITQHIGAYQVLTRQGHTVTIIDTPGHAAFTAMRARGAQAVDIVVLVVAGDDGVKPHTEEALNHARAAGTPVVVALNKKDKPGFDLQKSMTQLAQLGLNPEEWGGETAMLQVSGLTGEGVEELLERVFLEGELLDLRAHPDGPASGVVLEAEIQQGKGIIAHLLVQDGTLNTGDIILAGEGYGKVKAIQDDRGQVMKKAGPATPVEVTGLSALPGVGDSFHVVESLAKAKEVAEERERNNRARAMAQRRGASPDLQAILGKTPATEKESINVIVRCDVQGSVEVIKHALGELTHEEVEVRLLHAGVGAITESDVDLAITSSALLVAFHVGVNGKARTAAERSGITIERFDVIYELLDHLRNLMEGALAPEFEEQITGHVEIRRLFKSSRIGLIAGCYVLDGIVARDSRVRVLRDGQVVHKGGIGSLRRESEDVREVREGFECGIVLRDFRDIREGDIIETFKVIEVKRTLDHASR